MTNLKITGLTELAEAPATGDFVPIVDVSDTTQGADGTTKKVTKLNLVSGILSSKVTEETRELVEDSGAVSYTGAGFRPTSVEIIYFISGYLTGSGQGFSDSGKTSMAMYWSYTETSKEKSSNTIIYSEVASNSAQSAVVTSYDADGITLTWTKIGSPAATLTMLIRYFR